ncbi:MAG: head-tail connector protein [Xanthobacteraceae bacterium]
MWYPASVTTAPSAEPVTVDEVKAQAIIDDSDNDALIGRLIGAARSHVEAYCNIVLAKQIVAVRCDAFCDFARLPIAPVQEIESISYIDRAGDAQALPDTVYELQADNFEAAIVLKTGQRWPDRLPGSRITVSALIGYEDVPPAIVHAMLMWIADAYAKREIEAPAGFTAFDALLCNFRRGV